uniref:isopentenyl-diphosphate Delta-isomerase n=2 Tax=Hirondellea gigas TaxID=1518452 RepID=A0A2R5L127_9CRUS
MTLDKTQEQFLEEQCIVVDMQDKKIGADSKRTCHKNVNIKKGLLHRAFSVFLFNSDGKLLLQQRAAEKITFPNVWTNSCCSHPLSIDGEVESKDDLAEKIEGVKTAAIRKLSHELGIKEGTIARKDFHFLTRIYYRSTEDHPEWGEHEIDYILFVRQNVEISAAPNEVKAVRYVTASELRDQLADREKTGETFSPWVQLIIERFLYSWMEKLDDIIAGKCGIDETIHNLGDRAI